MTVVMCLCRVHKWCMYGACMVHVWCMYGACKVHVPCMYVACMVHVWCMYHPCMRWYPWCTSGAGVVQQYGLQYGPSAGIEEPFNQLHFHSVVIKPSYVAYVSVQLYNVLLQLSSSRGLFIDQPRLFVNCNWEYRCHVTVIYSL